ncbi:hypothetical protein RhiirC2_782174 [Rhizophagus irregularis]|uniref:Uncharacterized protein n=1 Tax=Rhizophagus irregularis TaxID=588596 RepID=A0A2N1N3S8_9GLOM|nr:hypothetical protein RhiirC2_782174 [Rhizophagus irregularis]
MATIQDVMTLMAPLLAQIPQYEGVAGFNDAMKVTVLSGKMEGRFVLPNPFNNGAGNPVNTPALFQVWLRDKYREVKIVVQSGVPMKKSTKPKEGVTKKSLTSKSHAKNTKASNNIAMATDQIGPEIYIEILIEILKFINSIFPKLKDHCLNTVMANNTVKRKELAWENVTKKIVSVQEKQTSCQVERKANNNNMEIETLPNNNHSGGGHTLNHAIKAYDADDVATIYCKIGGLVIPCAMIDIGSDSSIFLDNIAKLVKEPLGIEINRKKIHRLNGIASQSISISTMDNIPITIGSEENTATIMDEVSVVPAEKDRNRNAKSLVILGTQWQYCTGWEPLIKGEFKATCNGKTITIPLSVHKSQHNVFIEFRYPYLFLHHKKTKCWINSESTMSLQQDKVKSTLGNVESTMSLQQVNIKSIMSLQPDNVESRISPQLVNVGSKIKLD